MPPTPRTTTGAVDLPDFTSDPVDRLRHTLAAFADADPSSWAVVATSNAVPGHPRTGLTWDDLRSVLRLVDQS